MRSNTFYTLLAVLTATVGALPANLTSRNNPAPQNTIVYATFYDSRDCTGSHGIAVSTENAGCLANESGRNSVRFEYGSDADILSMALVWSGDAYCSNQIECSQVSDWALWKPWNLPACYLLDAGGDGYNAQVANSFRFVAGGQCSWWSDQFLPLKLSTRWIANLTLGAAFSFYIFVR